MLLLLLMYYEFVVKSKCKCTLFFFSLRILFSRSWCSSVVLLDCFTRCLAFKIDMTLNERIYLLFFFLFFFVSSNIWVQFNNQHQKAQTQANNVINVYKRRFCHVTIADRRLKKSSTHSTHTHTPKWTTQKQLVKFALATWVELIWFALLLNMREMHCKCRRVVVVVVIVVGVCVYL